MKRRTILNRIICALLTVLLIIELIVSLGITLLKNTICSKEYIEKELVKNNYYEITKSEIEDSFKYYVLQSNLDDNCVEGLITVEKVKNDTLLELNKYYDNSKQEIDIDPIKQELTKRIYDKVENEYNNSISEQEKKDIETLVKVIVKNYSDNMKTIGTCFETLSTLSKKLDKIESREIIIAYGITLFTVVLISIVYVYGTKNKKIIVNKYHAIALMTVGLMIIIIIIAMSIAVNEQPIQIFTKGITAVIVDIIKNIKLMLLLSGIVMFTVGLVISIIKNIMLKKYLR